MGTTLYAAIILAGLLSFQRFAEKMRISLDTVQSPLMEYDFIVVGAGTAGAIVASRLAELSKFSVLVIEAGREPSFFSSIPRASLGMLHSEVDWWYAAQPQRHASLSYPDRRPAILSGKMVGGGSNLNYMVYKWPLAEDMNRWADLLQDPKWQFSNFKNYLQRIETVQNDEFDELHQRGTRGPMHISTFPCRTSVLCSAFLEATEYQNLNGIPSMGGEDVLGFTAGQSNVWKGKRWSVVDGYLKPTLQLYPERLHLLIDAFVTKIEFADNRATAVRVTVGNSKHLHIRARKEIIVSAGAIQSPRLLLRSGIGPPDHLQDMNIPLIKSLPVGNNFLDHIGMLLYITTNTTSGPTLADFGKPHHSVQYFTTSTGLFADNGIHAIGLSMRPSGKPGILLHYMYSFGSPDPSIVSRIINIGFEDSVKLFPLDDFADLAKPGFVINVGYFNPKSRGTIRLQRDDMDSPRSVQIDPNYLSEADDVDALQDGILRAQEIINSPSLQKLGSKLHLPDLEDCRPPHIPKEEWQPTLSSTYYTHCWIRHAQIPQYRIHGGNRMGVPNRSDTVVDSNFRVVGLEGLRVVDASVFPFPLATSIQSLVYAVGDMAADTILEDTSNYVLSNS